jgi:hypothetical protein
MKLKIELIYKFFIVELFSVNFIRPLSHIFYSSIMSIDSFHNHNFR